MSRTTKREFSELLVKVRQATEEERRSLSYYASLAEQRRRYGSYVYVHAKPPRLPVLVEVRVSRWGRSNNPNHYDVAIGLNKANFGVDRCRILRKAAS